MVRTEERPIPSDYYLQVNLPGGKPAEMDEDYLFSVDKNGKPVIKGTNTPLEIKAQYYDKPVNVTLDHLVKGSTFTGSDEKDTINVKNTNYSTINGSPKQDKPGILSKILNFVGGPLILPDQVNVTNSKGNVINLPTSGEVTFGKGCEDNKVNMP